MSRVNIRNTQPKAYDAMFCLEGYLGSIDLPAALIEVVKIRASQINGCAFCIQMHSDAALKAGETNKRLFALPAWKESALFSDEERAVLALTEEITLISKHGVSDQVYTSLQKYFKEEQIAQLIMLITVINAWNRIAISTHA